MHVLHLAHVAHQIPVHGLVEGQQVPLRYGGGQRGQPPREREEGSRGVARLRHPVRVGEDPVPGLQRHADHRGRVRPGQAEAQRRRRVHPDFLRRPVPQQQRRRMAAADHPYDGFSVGELQHDRGGEELRVFHDGGVHDQSPVQPRRHPREVLLVQYGFAEGAQQSGDRGDRFQPVSPHVGHHGPYAAGPFAHVVQVAAHQRPALRGPVQPRAPHPAHGGGQRRQYGELGGLGHRADRHQLLVAAGAHPGDDRAEHDDDHHREQVRGLDVPGPAAVRQAQRHQGETAEHHDGHRAVGERRDRCHGDDEVTQLEGLGGDDLGEGEEREDHRGQGPQPARLRRSAQPA